MKKRLPNNILLPPLFNFGLHRKNNLLSRHWENSSYKRKTEVLENPIHKSLRLSEFVTFFWNLLEARGKIAIINTEDRQAFSYADWLEGSGIKCYEGSWIPGIWSNSLLNDPLPDLVILLSLNPTERSTVLWDLQNLNLPLINFSNEPAKWNLFSSPVQDHYQVCYFYMEIIRYLVLHFQHDHPPISSAVKLISDELNFYSQIRHFITRQYGQTTSATKKKLWSHSQTATKKNLKKWHIQKNLIYSKRKKRRLLKPFGAICIIPPIKFLQKACSSQEKSQSRKKEMISSLSSRGNSNYGWRKRK